ncbi:MAG: citronellol/citronellal dehydrogenase, partial [Thermoleophilaceae bacterium]|nr:citronellol/citronellal dehydrogenase [Thermoleophilaceae bacterium]
MPSRIFAPGLLDGQVILVSGGGTGLGRATAIELAALGAQVVVTGRRAEPLEETVALCEDGRCSAEACDIREEERVHALVDGVLERHGRIDTLVNNAGGQYMTPAEDITPKGFDTVQRLNVRGTWLMTHAAATKAMIPGERGGKVLNVTLSPHHGLPGMAHSSSARAAVENLTRVLSIEWARFGIKVNALAAGHFATEALKKYPKPVYEGVARTVPLQRLGEPEEHAWLVAYLASRA